MKKRLNKIATKIQRWATKEKEPKFIQIIDTGSYLLGVAKNGRVYKYGYDKWEHFNGYYSNNRSEISFDRMAQALETIASPEKKK